MHKQESRPDDSAAVDAMLNEGGHMATGNFRRAAKEREAARVPGPYDEKPLHQSELRGKPLDGMKVSGAGGR